MQNISSQKSPYPYYSDTLLWTFFFKPYYRNVLIRYLKQLNKNIEEQTFSILPSVKLSRWLSGLGIRLESKGSLFQFPKEAYIFILKVSLVSRSLKLGGALANEIKHDPFNCSYCCLERRYNYYTRRVYIYNHSIALKLIELEILWVFHIIPFGLSLFVLFLGHHFSTL